MFIYLLHSSASRGDECSVTYSVTGPNLESRTKKLQLVYVLGAVPVTTYVLMTAKLALVPPPAQLQVSTLHLGEPRTAIARVTQDTLRPARTAFCEEARDGG